jgi:NAD(P)-dependent dehydrogenase (short-subunit alcohol dehydrogenase family)
MSTSSLSLHDGSRLLVRGSPAYICDRRRHGDHLIVAGATRGAGRGIATELGAAGVTVYATGRMTRGRRSPMNRAETIEETAEMVTAAGGRGIPVRVDHSDPAQVPQLAEQIKDEQGGRLDVLVNGVLAARARRHRRALGAPAPRLPLHGR